MNENPYQSPLVESEAPKISKPLSPLWLTLSVILHGGGFVLYLMAICGCHFHLLAVQISIPPIVWGVIAFAACRNQVVAYTNAALVVGWLFFSWGSNIRFLYS